MSDDLRRQAACIPDRTFLAQRDDGRAWIHLTYAQARDRADRISQWLLDNGHNGDNPVAILSDNSLNFAVLQLAAMQVGIPAMPVSPAYSLMSKDFAKVRYVCDSFTPSLIYVEDAALFKPALAAVKPAATIVATKNADAIAGAIPFDDLLAAEPGEAVERAYAAVTNDSIGKILLTSGSTGLPKGVINTQRLMCSSVTQIGQVWPFLYDEPPAICDWLPWNHTFAANFCFNTVLRFGGTYWMDEGKPVPGRFEATLRNLREVRINQYLNVTRAYDMLVPALEADPAFAEHMLGDCQYLFYAGAGLPQALWDRIEALSIRVRGARIPMMTSLGSTETGPPAIKGYWPSDLTGTVGLPIPGLEAKLAPAGGKTEIRFRGPNIAPGYYRNPEKTAEAFDGEGFYRIGDAVKWLDESDPMQGLSFDGRVAENFKLLTGTWVATGVLRLDVLSHIGAAGVGRGGDRRGSRRGRPARLRQPGRLQGGDRAGGGGPDAGRTGRPSGGARGPAREDRRLQPGPSRLQPAGQARAADDRSARYRRRRDHRQGLSQPARHPERPRRAGGKALRRRRCGYRVCLSLANVLN